MANRFFVKPPVADRCLITGESAHHMINVMRMKAGDSVTLFDGTNREYQGSITELDRKSVTISIQSVNEVSREPEVRSTLAVAFPKGDRQKFMIEKLVELGVNKLVPLLTERSVVKIQPRSMEKIERWIEEASKQSGRNQLMQVEPAVSFKDWIQRPTEGPRFLADPRAPQASVTDAARRAQTAKSVSLSIGPEGGFTSQEIEDAGRAGWAPLRLGTTTLRIETAAIAAASLFSIAGSLAVNGQND
ncbi:MAG: 16S rRNA (uracil(1498)-N(3))-methyltransferase [Mariniblastus sp.]|nr:16S rRNA (uracil(1498)-N(3))-methyltransferase [Mariniblastus sp.]